MLPGRGTTSIIWVWWGADLRVEGARDGGVCIAAGLAAVVELAGHSPNLDATGEVPKGELHWQRGPHMYRAKVPRSLPAQVSTWI